MGIKMSYITMHKHLLMSYFLAVPGAPRPRPLRKETTRLCNLCCEFPPGFSMAAFCELSPLAAQ